MSLARKAIVGALWTSGANYFAMAVGFAFGILRDRVLMPDENGIYMFGLAAVDLVFILAGVSLNISVIQSGDEDAHLYSTAFLLTIALSVCMSIACAATAYALYLRHTTLIKIQAFLFLGGGNVLNLYTLLFSAYLEKQLEYKRIAKINVVSVLAFPVTSYLLVTHGWGAWGMVWGNLASFLVSFAGMSLVSRYPIGWRFDATVARRMISMGWKLVFSRGMEVVFVRYGTLVTESQLGTTLQGSYGRALKYWELAPQTVSPSVVTVALPTYSKLQHDREKLSRAFSMVLFLLVRVLLPFVLVFGLLSASFLRIIGPQWSDAIDVLRILAVGALLSPVFENMKVLLYAKGKPEMLVRIRVVQLIVFLPAMYYLVRTFGINGAAMAIVLNLVIGVIGVGRYVGREVSVPWIRHIAAPLGFSAVASAVFLAFPMPALSIGSIGQFVAESVYVLGMYLLLEIVFESRAIRAHVDYIRSVVRGSEIA